MWQKISKISQKFTVISLVLKLALFGFLMIWANPANATGELEIVNVEVNVTQEKVTITWHTNIPATGRIEYGETVDYGRTITAQVPANTNHEINLFGLLADTDYHFRVISYTANDEVFTFDQTFNTDDVDDRIVPEIENISLPYITGTTATIQWETSEPTSYVVYYGNTTDYGKKKSSSSRKVLHELTLTKLSPATTYHYKIEVKDKDGNKVSGQDNTFRTLVTANADQELLTAYNIKPISSKDIGITNRSAVVTWQTNKLADGFVRYGTKADKLNKKVVLKDVLKSFDHRVQITGLKAETQYYYQVESKDVFGKKVKSDVKSFITPALPISAGQNVRIAANKANKTKPDLIYKVGNKLYALLNGRKHYIKNTEIFSRNGYDWSKIKVASQKLIENTPDAKLVKSPDNATVYYLYKKGQDKFLKLPIPSAQVFSSYPQNSWSQVVTVDKLDVDTYNTASLVKAKGDSTVYFLENNTKRPIASAQVFINRGYSWSDIVEINETHLKSYTTGTALQ